MKIPFKFYGFITNILSSQPAIISFLNICRTIIAKVNTSMFCSVLYNVHSLKNSNKPTYSQIFILEIFFLIANENGGMSTQMSRSSSVPGILLHIRLRSPKLSIHSRSRLLVVVSLIVNLSSIAELFSSGRLVLIGDVNTNKYMKICTPIRDSFR